MGRAGHCSAAKCEHVEHEVVGGGRKFSREAGGMWSMWPGKESVRVLFSCSLLY